MAGFNNFIFLDTDVLINWLVHEKESRTDKPLWPSVEKILLNIQDKKLRGATSILSIMEIRTFLGRETKANKAYTEREVSKINSLLSILVPNDITILLANQIQVKTGLTVIDAIQVAIVQENLPSTLITRDNELLTTAKTFIPAATPEELLVILK